MTLKMLPVCLLIAATAAGCASSGGGGSAAQQSTSTNRNRDLITREELAAPDARARSLMDVVKTLRPQYLSVRGMQSFKCGKTTEECAIDADAGTVHVSVDNGRILPVQELENIHAGTVQEVRFLNSAQAMQKFGGAAQSGPVILVLMAK